ncbi:TPA: helix-turn-helix domain-containing protein [Streptococcus suis]|nr:helix-turn-helix domain-containing protein [Streptococcus suis]HEM5991370.1 helix-turn-helix domain-containing protein [Streptococcus suis]HEM6196979.1 helix-turn-helix domain-containing protein [Streptococcus suis]HEP1779663.1 helix-turn-helix domain-containing protein [Streptococcus suis]HEP1781777.1 helix-turn-helix domain-containing protein [Streptococcus suis]
MNLLEQLLLRKTEHELLQEKQGFVADYLDIQSASQTPKLSQHFFFQNKDIFISKHSRYAAYPEHTHQFLEINYVYKGRCRQQINGQEFELKEGDILLMDVESRHSIEALRDEDILINILFQNKDVSINWLKQLQGENSLLYQFLLSDSSQHFKRDNFLLLHTEENSPVRQILTEMITEYFLPQEFSQQMLKHYLPLFFYQLARLLPTLEKTVDLHLEESTYAQILKIIDREYATISLTNLAKRLSFNKNYLSNLIKAESGQTFTQLVNQRKLMKAQLLLRTTQLPIQEIALSVGFSNKTYFYEKYKETFGHGPKEERKS